MKKIEIYGPNFHLEVLKMVITLSNKKDENMAKD